MKSWKLVLLAYLIPAIVAMICIAVVIRRGFNANAAPSAFETFVARAVRNYAIPSRDRNQTNPLNTSTELIQEGRDHFVARCAVCHGNDGSGVTQTGTSFYPRVPDLRSPATQNLTDGDLHYIIENGVQLTGMPAGAAHHAASADDSWPLVTFIRSLRTLTAAEHSTQFSSLSAAHYIGSQA